MRISSAARVASASSRAIHAPLVPALRPGGPRLTVCSIKAAMNATCARRQ
jgi:hypothetical protein